MEFCNNVDYNWQNAHNIDGDQLNMIGNYYKAGPSRDVTKKPIQLKTGNDPVTARGYFSGNYFEGLPKEYNKDNYTAMDYNASGLGFGAVTNYKSTTREDFEVSERFDAGVFQLKKIELAQETYESCLKHSGCSLVRDEVDKRFIQTIIDNTGRLIDSQSEVGGWDLYPAISRPDNWDGDQDGMPDEWEVKMGLDPNNTEDRNGDNNGDGYTNLENYLNGLITKI